MKHLIKSKISFLKDEKNSCTLCNTEPMWVGPVDDNYSKKDIEELNYLERKISALMLGIAENSTNLPGYIYYVQTEREIDFSRIKIINLMEYYHNKDSAEIISLKNIIKDTKLVVANLSAENAVTL